MISTFFLENTYTLTFLKLKVDHIIVYDGGKKGQSWKVQPEKYFRFKKIYMVVQFNHDLTFSTQKLPMRKQKVAFHYREVIVIRQKYFCSERIEN